MRCSLDTGHGLSIQIVGSLDLISDPIWGEEADMFIVSASGGSVQFTAADVCRVGRGNSASPYCIQLNPEATK